MVKNNNAINCYVNSEWQEFFMQPHIRRLRNNELRNGEKIILCYLQLLGIATETNFRVIDEEGNNDFAKKISYILLDAKQETVQATIDYFMFHGLIIQEAVNGYPTLYFPEAERIAKK